MFEIIHAGCSEWILVSLFNIEKNLFIFINRCVLANVAITTTTTTTLYDVMKLGNDTELGVGVFTLVFICVTNV